MANIQSQNVKGLVPSPVATGQEAVCFRQSLSLTTAQIANTNVLEMIEIPVGYSVVDWTVDSDDLDSNGTPTVAFKVGILNAGKTDLDTGSNIWATSQTTAQAGGVARMANQNAIRCGSSTSKRTAGIVFTAGAATVVAGEIGLTLYLKAD